MWNFSLGYIQKWKLQNIHVLKMKEGQLSFCCSIFFFQHFNFRVKQFKLCSLMVFGAHFTNWRKNKTEERTRCYNGFHFSSFLFNLMFLKYFPVGMEVPSRKLKWKGRILHTERLTNTFPISSPWVKCAFADLTQECEHHKWRSS